MQHGLSELIQPNDVVISTVGPFQRYGFEIARAAVNAETHYVDSTGEPEFVLNLRRQLDGSAARNKIGQVVPHGFHTPNLPKSRITRNTITTMTGSRRPPEPVRASSDC